VTHEFVNPNWHVVFIHAPLGLVIIGTLIELFSFMWARHAFRAAGRWMIFIGALTAAPTALSGIYAMWDVNNPDAVMNDSHWADSRATSPVQEHAWEMLKDHAWLNGSATVALLLLVVIWLGCSDDWRRKLHLPMLAILVGSVITIIWGSWNGGEMIYRHGVGVQAHASEAGVAESEEGSLEGKSTREKIEYFIPPMQLHITLAGTAIALGMAALGLSLRQTNRVNADIETPEAAGIAAAFESRPMDLQRDALRYPGLPDEYHRVPAARFWLLACLAALCTALVGAWILGSADPKELWGMITMRDKDSPQITRRMAHVTVGVSIVVVTLILSLITRFAPRKRIVLGIFALLLLIAVGSQVWLGSLLLLDSPDGTITAFNEPSSDARESKTTPPRQPTTARSMSTTRPSTR
jgi:uncharacterized membrane protein